MTHDNPTNPAITPSKPNRSPLTTSNSGEKSKATPSNNTPPHIRRRGNPIVHQPNATNPKTINPIIPIRTILSASTLQIVLFYSASTIENPVKKTL
jgi:hypothetical protein